MLVISLLAAMFFCRVESKEIEIPNLHGYRRSLMNGLNDKMILLSQDVQGLSAGPFLRNYHSAMTLVGQLDLMCYSRAFMKGPSDDTFHELASAKLRLNSHAKMMVVVLVEYLSRKKTFYTKSLEAMDAFMTVSNRLSLDFLASFFSHNEETLIQWFKIFGKLRYGLTSLDLRLTSSTKLHQAEDTLLAFFVDNTDDSIIQKQDLKQVMLAVRKECRRAQSSMVRFRCLNQDLTGHQARITTLILNSN